MHSITLPWFIDLALFFIAFVAGTIDTIAGGGGLITLPAILATGLPPQLALGTNKLQSCFGVGTASFRLYSRHRPPFREIALGILFTAIGACIGAYTALSIRNQYLAEMIPPLLLLILMYSIFFKKSFEEEELPRLSPLLFYPLGGTLLGMYDGFLGPGIGAFWAISLVALLGFDMQKATILTKIFNFTSNFVSLIWFMWVGQVVYSIGIYMVFGQILGGYCGAYFVSTRGTRLIRPMFITMVSLLLIILSVQTYRLERFL